MGVKNAINPKNFYKVINNFNVFQVFYVKKLAIRKNFHENLHFLSGLGLKGEINGRICLFFVFFLMRGFSVGRDKICQDFSWDFCATEDFGRKFQGEIFKISPLNLQDLSPKFAVKLRAIFKSLIINALQFRCKSALFCQDFLPIFAHTAIPLRPATYYCRCLWFPTVFR